MPVNPYFEVFVLENGLLVRAHFLFRGDDAHLGEWMAPRFVMQRPSDEVKPQGRVRLSSGGISLLTSISAEELRGSSWELVITQGGEVLRWSSIASP